MNSKQAVDVLREDGWMVHKPGKGCEEVGEVFIKTKYGLGQWMPTDLGTVRRLAMRIERRNRKKGLDKTG